jgi:glutathione S-transferase
MSLQLFWGKDSPYCWRVMLALEHKGLAYDSQAVALDQQEHQSPHMLKLNPRGRVPVLRDGDYVVFESVAILYYLDWRFPVRPIFGGDPQEAGVISRVICEYQAYAEPSLMKIVEAVQHGTAPDRVDELTEAMHIVAREARTIEGRLSKADWIVGLGYSAVDMVVFPGIQLLRRALAHKSAAELGARFLPMETNYPALARWIARIESLPGYARACPRQ